MRWAGGAGRRERQHRLHTFQELLTRTPHDPHDYAPEAAMPRPQWETLLRDVVQGLDPPTPLRPSAGGSRPPTPRQTPCEKTASPPPPLECPLASHPNVPAMPFHYFPH